MYAEAEKANCSTFCEGKDLYQVQETLENLCEFSTVLADREVFGSTQISAILKSFKKLQYGTFEGAFFIMCFGAKIDDVCG